mmetsp:Transcript_23441/g.52136  ORF Transcript_23441/g.52136 Transcript_23441/m.52136 type:complete len:350 (+) Transcript_23441:1-1050(+)
MGSDAQAAPVLLGLIADIQYADQEDGTDFSGHERRHFRNALEVARAAVDHWNEANVEMVVQLGDVIDGINARAGASASALETVLEVLGKSRAKRRFDLIGNHELYNIRRDDLASSGLNCHGPGGATYYSVRVGAGWEAVFLDAYEHALIGVQDDHPSCLKAKEVMQANNPKVLSMVGGGDWFSGLPVEKHRYVPFNGGVSAEQVAWLGQVLEAAEKEGRSVLVFSHVAVHEAATKPKTLVWNSEEVLAVLHRHREAVVAVLSGHDHNGGYGVDEAGIHHVTMNAALTAEPGRDCFATLECRPDRTALFVAHGRACVESGTNGRGRAYSELVLARGAVNTPGGPALKSWG